MKQPLSFKQFKKLPPTKNQQLQHDPLKKANKTELIKNPQNDSSVTDLIHIQTKEAIIYSLVKLR